MSDDQGIEPEIGDMPYDAVLPFTSQSIMELDGGRARLECNRRIREIVEDIRARPMDGEGKATADRCITIKLVLRPVIGTDELSLIPLLESIDGHVEINNSRPKTTGRKLQLQFVNNQLCWQPNNQSKFNQPVLPFKDE